MARTKKEGTHTVAVAFKDSKMYADNVKVNSYEVGADVSDLDADRLDLLVKRGIVTLNKTE